MREMHPNLVGAPGFQAAGEQARERLAVGAAVFSQELPVGYRLATAGPDRLLVARLGVAVERSVDCAPRPLRRAPHEGEIGALQRSGAAVIGELGRKCAMCTV